MATVAPSISAVSDRKSNRPDSMLIALMMLLSGFGLLMIWISTRHRSTP